MLVFVTRYVKSLGVLLVAMILYGLVVVPLVEPPARQSSEQEVFSPELPHEHWWQDFFAEDSWQAGNPKIIKTKQGILLAHMLEEVDESTLSFKPITMIMPQTQAGREAIERNELGTVTRQDMWIVSAEEGATIHFSEPIKSFSGSLPKIKHGELGGEIEVSRQVASEAGQKAWRLRTRDLAINQSQLTTRNQVLIEWGGSVVQGRDLLIRLRGDLLGSEGSSSAAWGPLDELELYQVEKIDIELPPGGIWADFDPKRVQSILKQDVRQLPARLIASCGGRFSFDFKSSEATLRNGVQAQHFLGNLPPDTFSCERMILKMLPPKRNVRTQQAADEETNLIQLAGFEAIGADALTAPAEGDQKEVYVAEKSVILDAPAIGMTSKCKRLSVNLLKGYVEFSGRLAAQGATQSTVVLNYQGNEFSAPRIEYQAPPQEKNASHLGWLVAAGPGEFKSSGESPDKNPMSDLGKTNVRWQKALRMSPAPENDGSQWVELSGSTLVENEKHGFLTSDRIEVWLEKNPDSDKTPDRPKSGNESDSLTALYRPRRVFSASPTDLTTPKLSASVERLDLKLEYREEQPEAPSLQEDGLALTDSAGNPMYQWLGPPVESQTNTLTQKADSNGQGSTSSQPVRIEGQSLQATLIQRGKVNWIEQLHLDGPVRLSQAAEPEGKTYPWEIVGKELLLATSEAGDVDLQITGAPAEMKLADGLLRGESIRFNQAHSLVFMDHPGEFVLPKSLLKSSPSTEPSGLAASLKGFDSIEWLKAPKCRWTGRMLFDGSVVRIEEGIEFDAAMRSSMQTLWLIAGQSQEMEIYLAEAIDFKVETDGNAPQAELDRVSLIGQVDILASELDANGEKKSREEIHVPKLTFSLAEERFLAEGPGWTQSRFLSKKSLGQLAAARGEPSKTTLRGAYLTFRDSMVGLMDREEVVFEGRVEMLSGPLADWEQSIVPGDNFQVATDQILLNCDQLKIYDTGQLSVNRRSGQSASLSQSSEDTWEFQATGDVAFNGSSEKGQYLGNGYQLTYSKSKNLLMLRGDGRQHGYLQSLPKNAEDSRFRAQLESVAIDPESLSIVDLRLGPSGFQLESGDTAAGAGGQTTGAWNGASQPSSSGLNIPNPRGVDFFKSSR